MTVPLPDARLAEILSNQLGDWLPAEWSHEYVEAEGDDVAYYRLTGADGTVLAQLPDWAGPVALWIADAREAVPELLAEVDRLRAANAVLVGEVAQLGAELAQTRMSSWEG